MYDIEIEAARVLAVAEPMNIGILILKILLDFGATLLVLKIARMEPHPRCCFFAAQGPPEASFVLHEMRYLHMYRASPTGRSHPHDFSCLLNDARVIINRSR